MSSASFPGEIGGRLCYRITQEDAEKIVNGGEDTVLPYDVVIKSFSRQYDCTDEDYLGLDNKTRHR